ncbi:hypothetical protein ABKN59_008634 [Abortiporus biennis]
MMGQIKSHQQMTENLNIESRTRPLSCEAYHRLKARGFASMKSKTITTTMLSEVDKPEVYSGITQSLRVSPRTCPSSFCTPELRI